MDAIFESKTMATDQKSLISSLKDQESTLKSKIGDSSTYYTPGTPKKSDTSKQIELRALEKKRIAAEDALLKTQWYGDKEPSGKIQKDSMLSRGLKLLSIHNYAQVGAIEAITGKGTKSGIWENIQANIEEEEAYGSLLQKFGVHKTVAAPVGFALDIATDPWNWATDGTAATIPRAFVGLKKAGLKGLKEGLASSVPARGAAYIAKKTPIIKNLPQIEKAVAGVAKATSSYNKTIGKDVLKELADQVSAAATKKAGKLPGPLSKLPTGREVRSMLEDSPKAKEWMANKPKNLIEVEDWLGAKPGPWFFSKGRGAEAIAEWQAKAPAGVDEVINWKKNKPFGKRLVDTFAPEPDWHSKMKEIDELINKQLASGELVVGARNIARRTDELTGSGIFARMELARKKYRELGPEGYQKWRATTMLDEGAQVATEAPAKYRLDPNDVSSALEGEYEIDRRLNKYVQTVANKTDANFIEEGVEPTVNTLEEARAALATGIKTAAAASERTGVKWFDEMSRWFRGIKIGDLKVKITDSTTGITRERDVGEAIADSYNLYMGMFKTGKIGGNLIGAWTRGIIGNHSMGLMAGFNAWEKEYYTVVSKAGRFINGRMSAEKASRFIKENFLGNPKWVDVINNRQSMFHSTFGIHPAFLNKSPGEIVQTVLKSAKNSGIDVSDVNMSNFSDIVDELRKAGVGLDIRKSKAPMGEGITKTMAKRTTEPGAKTAFFNEELMGIGGGFTDFVNYVGRKAETGGKGWELMNWYLNRPMDIFSSVDARFKLGYALKMSNKGLTEKEILMVKNFYPNIGRGIQFDEVTQLYKVDPEEALGVVNEVFMNYSTMPAAVKVLRSLPFFGAPFGSFMYGMGAKTAKTARYNPAIFSKINYFLKEFQGDKTPLERQQMESPYYSWYNKDGMVKLPFMQDNPVYLNVADMIPYYTMNLMQPSERDYDSFVPSTITSILDKLPFFQQPEGQVMLDYLILPTILRESNPKGRFGQPLWKTDSTLLEKFGYAARSMAETPLPTLSGVAGIPGGIIAPWATEAVPNFRYRQLANKVQGKGSTGISSKEDALAGITRILSGMFGVPWYKMNLSFAEDEATDE